MFNRKERKELKDLIRCGVCIRDGCPQMSPMTQMEEKKWV
jgi:hypothetical protein